MISISIVYLKLVGGKIDLALRQPYNNSNIENCLQVILISNVITER